MPNFHSLVLLALLTALPIEGAPLERGQSPPELPTGSIALGPARFPHSTHAFDLEIECVACHHETDAAALNIPHPEYFDDFWIQCQTCHRAGAPPAAPQSCSGCHHSSPTSIADETLSAKVVVHRTCFTCHEAGTGASAARSCGTRHRDTADDEKGGTRG